MAGRKLFLADDSLTIQKVINLTFADEGVEVLTASDGDAAVHRIPEEMPDVVLADVNMPGLNGYELCELLRQDDRTRHIPVLLLVGAFEQFDEEEAARVGANSHITKPFQSIRQLVNEVTDLMAENVTIDEAESAPVSELAPESDLTPEPVQEAELTADAHSVTSPFDEPVGSQLEAFREDRIGAIDQSSEIPAAQPLEASTDPASADLAPVEADDIDRLYRQSIGEESLPPNEDFPDLGVDDEMIETSYTAPDPAGDGLDLLAASAGNEGNGSEDPLPSLSAETYPDESSSPYRTAELDPVEIPETRNEEAPAPFPQAYETVRLDPAMVNAKMAEINQRFEQVDQPPAPLAATFGEETIRMDDRSDTKGSGGLQLEDVDLLDIPAEMEVGTTSAFDAPSPGGKQVVTLSPEVIEMIAQRVVEKLAEKR